MEFAPSRKQFWINVVRLFVRPVTCQTAFFLLLFTLLVLPDVLTESICSTLSFYRIPTGLFVCYLLSLPVVLLSSMFRRSYKTIIGILASILFVVDIYMLILYGQTLGTVSKESISAILATNPAEAYEFASVYLTTDRLLVVVVSVSLVLILFYYVKNLHFRWNNISRGVLAALLLLSVYSTIGQWSKVVESNIYYLLTKECPDLREYRQNPTVVSDGEYVDNIVVIIGESFSKYQSSLYGYEKETNPLLGELRADSSLYVYENITSACVTTIPSMKSIMMAYTDSMGDSIEWYRCLTLLEVMQKTGYRTYWLSNQSKTGLYDNEVGRFADLCDEQFFVGDKYSGMVRDSKDEELLPLFEDCLSNDTTPKFIVLHLMGSHAEYDKRYPAEYGKYNSDDYVESHSHLSSSNRDVVAQYDNTVLYNDYVVSELMKRVLVKDAVVLYLSDHGEDVFRSSCDYCGHATERSEQHKNVVRQIPLMFYTTPLFRDRHSALQHKIESSVKNPYRTDSIMYTIMDMAGVETVNGVSYKHKSLLK